MAEPTRDERRSACERSALLARLCAVHAFHPTAVPGLRASDCLRLVRRDVDVIAIDDERSAWSLRREARCAALAAHPDAASVLAAARSIPDRPMTPAQRLLERWLEHGPPSPIAETTAPALDLDALELVAGWLEDVPWARDGALAVRRELLLGNQRARLEATAGAHFVGRRHERAALRDVIEGRTDARLVVLDALGGMGKSALLARVGVDLGAWRPDSPVTLVHLDLDDVEIDPESVASVLAALSRQLEARDLESFAGLSKALQDAGHLESAPFAFQASDRAEVDSRLHAMVPEIQEAVGRAAARGRITRLWIVVDTFERALRRSPELARDLLRDLWSAIGGVPSSLVVAGRGIWAAAPDRAFWPVAPAIVQLGELDLRSAEELLSALGLTDEALVRRLVDMLPRRPLTLRLAARAVLAQPAGRALDDALLRDAIARALTDGYLHLRVLMHLEDPRVRAIVHPGFALRCITPAAILHVLRDWPAPPVRDEADAKRLFDALRRVHDLVVETADEEALVLRPEVRRELVELMMSDRPEDIRRVHRAAASWFSGRDELVEAAYHLLALEDFEALEARWTPAIEEALAPLVDGLSPRARGWLERRAPPSHAMPTPRAHVSWEQQMLARAEPLLAEHRLDALEELLAQWERAAAERGGAAPDSALPCMRARLERLRGRPDTARTAARDALQHPRPPAIADEMRRVLAWECSRDGDLTEVLRRIATARSHPDTAALSPKERLASLVDLAAILAPRREHEARRVLWSLEDDVAEAFDACDDGALRGDGALLLAAGGSFHDARRLLRAIALGALDRVREPYVDGLAVALDDQGPALAEELDWTAAAADVAWDRAGRFPWHDVLAALGQRPELLAKLLSTLLENHGGAERIVASIRWLFAQQGRAGQEASRAWAEERIGALSDLAMFVDRHVPPHERAPLLGRLGGRMRAAGLDASMNARALVVALDSGGALAGFVRALMAARPDHAADLWGIRARLSRRPPFQHVAHERLRELHAALVASPLAARDGLATIFAAVDPDVLGASADVPPHVQLIEVLDRLNETERLGGAVPLAEFLDRALRLDLGGEALGVVRAMWAELLEHQHDGVPPAQLLAPDEGQLAAVVGEPRPDVASFREHAEAIGRSTARLVVHTFARGRGIRDAAGRRELRYATAWLIASELLLTAQHAVDAPPGAELELYAVFRDGEQLSHIEIRSVAAQSVALGYAALWIQHTGRAPLNVATEPFPGDRLAMVSHDGASGADELSVHTGMAVAVDESRIAYLLSTWPAIGGAPICDVEGRIVALHRGVGLTSNDGPVIGNGTRMSAVLEDLKTRFPDVYARIPRAAGRTVAQGGVS
ncbi:trypsin-like peptidase domain-containing protein [Sorangium sp. So ce385]|uniref:trypsin-like peptidase domain-containing protein n=1 Tax=Sorangium sp. So ce385 TaxID=3133308 RepID=UPI003F5BDB84